jgi:hypothetical protein
MSFLDVVKEIVSQPFSQEKNDDIDCLDMVMEGGPFRSAPMNFSKPSQEELIQGITFIVHAACAEKDMHMRDSMLTLIASAITYNDIVEDLNWNPLVNNLSNFNESDLNYIVDFLDSSRKKKYRPLLETYLQHPNKDVVRFTKGALQDMDR